jgi:hypothetical protein
MSGDDWGTVTICPWLGGSTVVRAGGACRVARCPSSARADRRTRALLGTRQRPTQGGVRSILRTPPNVGASAHGSDQLPTKTLLPSSSFRHAMRSKSQRTSISSGMMLWPRPHVTPRCGDQRRSEAGEPRHQSSGITSDDASRPGRSGGAAPQAMSTHGERHRTTQLLSVSWVACTRGPRRSHHGLCLRVGPWCQDADKEVRERGPSVPDRCRLNPPVPVSCCHVAVQSHGQITDK